MMKRMLILVAALVLLCMPVLNASAQSTVDVIVSAGTTQAFKTDAVSEEDLTAILQAGLSAASAINQQPWHFAVITNQETMKEIGSSMSMGGMPAGAPAGMPNPPAGAPAGMTNPPAGAPEGMPKMPASSGAKAGLGDSPVAIVVYMNEGTASPDANFDCGLATQNMVIAANALGLGSKIVSAPTMALNGDKHDEICEKLGVDKAYKAVAVLLLGYADTDVDGATGASVRSSMDEKVSFSR
ncbi:MAG: nitroreductase family protein [Clostridia bacterium]|nr:nitroreductase family protein [Clostridia bacterium]